MVSLESVRDYIQGLNHKEIVRVLYLYIIFFMFFVGFLLYRHFSIIGEMEQKTKILNKARRDVQTILTEYNDIKNKIKSAFSQPSHKESNIIEVASQDDLRDLLQKPEQPSVIFLHMDGCGWCKKMEPVFQNVAANPEFASIKFYSVDGRALQASPIVKELTEQQINGYPSLLFMNKNGYLDKQVGFAQQEDLENKIKNVFK